MSSSPRYQRCSAGAAWAVDVNPSGAEQLQCRDACRQRLSGQRRGVSLCAFNATSVVYV